ncbi:hypothetical protein PYW08_009392 [Mythimna loreyi]|uniref:Uncharacterized protein n=1 Tax=Mythimna loreyi TaxID=667449 RepID=A0ACC2QDE4_9NEOP|nr:hypothetical protein PYW08_009392 [Mythimna loreyi]
MSSGFISESEILEARRRRQEEWDKVRTADQPEEAPEEPYDTRPLYQRLEEQRIQKEAEYEEAHKLKNMIRGLDDDEVGFLDLVERSKANAAQQISIEEQREMREFRERVSSLAESEELTRLRAQLAPARQTQNTALTHQQKNKLQGVVVRKRKASEMEGDKPEKGSPPPKTNGIVSNSPKTAQNGTTASPADCVTRCVGVLPGLGHYDTDSTSDTDESSDHDSNDQCCAKRDMLGRRQEEKSRKDSDKS